MARPSKEQLDRINDLTQNDLKKEQVFVFRSLSADSLPVNRKTMFGKDYSIQISDDLLNKLKDDYSNGVGLLASHDSTRLPFGRTFDAEVKLDNVDGLPVSTLYIDQYIVEYVETDDGDKLPLKTEISNMTTQDIANHIRVGHTFDTSIGFSIKTPCCSVCGLDIRDCDHQLGNYYEVEEGLQKRCDIVAVDGEGIENSLVYAGAVDRAKIQNFSKQEDNKHELPYHVNINSTKFYNVNDIKLLPKESDILCLLSKGNLDMFALYNHKSKGSELMSEIKEVAVVETEELENVSEVFELEVSGGEVVQEETKETSLDSELQLAYDNLKEDYEKVSNEKEDFYLQLETLKTALNYSKEEVEKLTKQVETLEVKLEKSSTLVNKFTEELISETIKAGVKSRGNSFNTERFEKYLKTLSIEEIKEELNSLNSEFSSVIEDARVTKVEQELKNTNDYVPLSESQLREQASKTAYKKYVSEGKKGNLEEMTKSIYTELKRKI
jgi:archaellum component FlaC